jgi:regulator of replication initiation timing
VEVDMNTALAFSNALEEIAKLEHKFVDEPDVETASKLAATRHVAHMLGMKLEKEKALRIEQQDLRKRAGFEQRYSEVNDRLNILYAEAEAGLEQALDATDEAVKLYHESRRLASFIDKFGGYVPVVEQSFWSRFPKLRDRFLNSVLRNGEP